MRSHNPIIPLSPSISFVSSPDIPNSFLVPLFLGRDGSETRNVSPLSIPSVYPINPIHLSRHTFHTFHTFHPYSFEETERARVERKVPDLPSFVSRSLFNLFLSPCSHFHFHIIVFCRFVSLDRSTNGKSDDTWLLESNTPTTTTQRQRKNLDTAHHAKRELGLMEGLSYPFNILRH